MDIETTDLIKACADSHHTAPWQEFVVRYQRPISLSVLRTLRNVGISSPDIVDDLVQDTYLKLCSDRCRHLLRFALEHPEAVDGYIKTIATNVTFDYLKSRRSMKRGSGVVGQFPEHAEPESSVGSAGGEQAIESAVLMREIDECLEQCSDDAYRRRDRLIFWLHYRQGMTASSIASLPAVGLTTKGVESAIFRLTRQVRERLTASQRRPANQTGPATKGFGSAKSY